MAIEYQPIRNAFHPIQNGIRNSTLQLNHRQAIRRSLPSSSTSIFSGIATAACGSSEYESAGSSRVGVCGRETGVPQNWQ